MSRVLFLFALAACTDAPGTTVFTLEGCPEGTPCDAIVADGAARFTVRVALDDTIDTPWRAGEHGAPDLTVKVSVAGATFLGGAETHSGTLDAEQRHLDLQLVAGTGRDVLVTATYLGVVQDLPLTLRPAPVESVNLSSSIPYFDATALAQITVTADVVGLGGASVSDGTRVTFAVAAEPATTGYTLTPTRAYVQDGEASADVVLLPGATHVTFTATAEPPTWGTDGGDGVSSEPFIVYAEPG